MILELHNKTKKNIGDRYCNPSRYFNFGNVESKRLNDRHDVKDKTLIIGGGGLIHKHFSGAIQTLLDKGPSKSVLWGVGHNSNSIPNEYNFYPAWTDRFDLIGIRDWINGHYDKYLPCVTCMHPAFNKHYKITKEVVFYTRLGKNKPKDTNPLVMNNQGDLDEIIAFLGSAKTVVTDSYHGAYWAQLLGKDVRVIGPWSVKFLHMKYVPTFIETMLAWKDSKPSYADNNFLEECKYLNTSFYQKVLSLR